MLKALIECFDQAGIQVKASMLIFGVREISFHNYTISKDQTRPKDENLCRIRNMSTPRSVTELKAFLGCTQQMSQYCRYYGVIASPLHRLTRVTEPFPKQWLPGIDYDIAFYRIKSMMMLDESLFLWNKDSLKRLFLSKSTPATKGGERVPISTRIPNLPTLTTKADSCSCPSNPNESLNGLARRGLNSRKNFPFSIVRHLRYCSA